MQDQIDGNGRPTLFAHLSFQSGLWSIVPYAVRINSPSKSSSASAAPGGSSWPMFRAVARIACAACLVQLAPPQAALGQLAPGPYEILPYDDACIIEAFRDLDLTSGNIADWTGWAGTCSGWCLTSPHPYDGHTRTDVSVQTGTALRAAAAGTVSGLETSYTRNQSSNTYGNFVRIAVDTRSPNGELLDMTYCHMLSDRKSTRLNSS